MSAQHKFSTHLPHNRREFTVFLLVVSFLSVNIIPVLIMASAGNLTLTVYQQMIHTLPLLWVTVISVVLLTSKPARRLKELFSHPGDSFNSQVLFEILSSVLILSVILTILGTWIGTRSVSLEPITHLLRLWPRNFAIAFAVELLIAQPIARQVMARWHQTSRCQLTANTENIPNNSYG
jgi:hypothetical protein